MREKYIDEAVGVWIEFGIHKSGNVDVSSEQGDIFTNVPPLVAAKLIKAQAEFRENLYRILRDVTVG
jgi:hypothetical protein